MITKYCTFLMCAALLLSCAHKSEKADTADYQDAEAQSLAATQTALAKATVPDIYSNGKKVIKKAHYRFEVNDAKASAQAIEETVRRFGAYIESSTLTLENPILENRITIRVVNESFADVLKEIDTQAIFVNFRNITTDDISKDFVDLESRLRTKREVEQRYTELLQAEEKIGELHEAIEATISRLNYMKDQITYSTIQIEFYQTIKQQIVSSEGSTFGEDAGKAMATGWHGIKKACILILYLWPVVVLLPVIYYFMRKRRIQNRMKSVGSL
jgi:Domain of unknown function (DUF4349)